MKKPSRSLAILSNAAVVLALAGPVQAFANADQDRQYALETVAALKSWDNVDGLFTEYVAAAYKDYFSHSSRFALQDASKADPILTHSKIPYRKLVEDKDLLGQISRAVRAESILRTRIEKDGKTYSVTLEWLHSPKMDLLATDTFNLEETAEGKPIGAPEIRDQFARALDRMIKKVPFYGHVTGRDGTYVTINIGASSGLKPGDTLLISTLEEAKRHPLLNAIVDWRLTSTGRIDIETVEDRIAFGRVTEEESGRKIGRYQKVVQILAKPTPVTPAPTEERKTDLTTPTDPLPRTGFASASAWTGSFTRQLSTLSGTSGVGGSGFLFGAIGEGQLWLTKELFVEGAFGFGTFGYSQIFLASGQSTGAGLISGTITRVRGDAGYSFLFTDSFFGPKAWVRLGYQLTSTALPGSNVDQSQTATDNDKRGSASFMSAFIGVGGDLPVRGNWGAQFNIDIGVIRSIAETGYANATDYTGISDVTLMLGGYYKLTPKMTLRAGFLMMSTGTDYLSGASLSQKTIVLSPSLLYYL